MSNPKIDAWYAIVTCNDAHSGKLIGAGVGFLMFYTESKRPMLHAMLKQALEEVRSRFDFEGSTVTMQ